MFMQDPLYTAAPKALRWFNMFQSLPKTLWSTLALRAGLKQSKAKKPYTVFTFTTSERFARVWHHFMRAFLPADQWHIIIGDSSGDIRPELFPGAEVIKIYNFTHGKKIDLFLHHVITSPIVFLCDDDVYLSRTLTPALEELRQPNIPVVSLRPRTWYTLRINGATYQPMGSYALLMKRIDISFMPIKKPFSAKIFPPGIKAQPFYDTADYANEQLLKNGYTIPIHDAEEFTMGFDGMTTPTILLRQRGIMYIRQALRAAEHFTQGSLNGAQVRGLYCLAAFEEMYATLFGDASPFEYSSREELRNLNRPELTSYFDHIDANLNLILRTLREKNF